MADLQKHWQDKTKRILVTAALPYANGPIHLGHLVEYVQADIFARFLKLKGMNAIFCCADDTHGTPIEIKAAQLGITPEELIARYYKEHIEDFNDFHIHFDSYYSTNSAENREFSELIYSKLVEKGLIYKKEIELIYCRHCKRFLPDRFVRGKCPNCSAEEQYGDVCEKCGTTHKTTDLIEPKCAVCSREPVRKTSQHYFFRLSEFSERLAEFLNTKKFQKEAVNFCIEWTKRLEDWCISRDGPYFGFNIPGEANKYFYVWLDAPVGYIASTANYCKTINQNINTTINKNINTSINKNISKTISKNTGENINKTISCGSRCSVDDYWLSRDSWIIHIIGKDIIYFHFLFWPAMLMSAGFHVPDEIMVHGFLTVNGEKMSKSRGTFITARDYLKHLDPQYLRFYYAHKLTGKMEDIDLDVRDFKEKINAELIANVANFAYRAVTFTNKNFDSFAVLFDKKQDSAAKIINEFNEKIKNIENNYRGFDFREVVKDIMHLSSLGNKYFQENEPWKLVKGNDAEKKKAHEVLSFCIALLKNLSIIISPILPRFGEQLQEQLNFKGLRWDNINFELKEKHKVGRAHILISKIEDELDDLLKRPLLNLDLRVGKVIKVDNHPAADKLYVLHVDLGAEKRQIVAGLRQFMAEEDVLGQNIIVVCNLEHIKIKGKESNGMLLAADKRINGKEVVRLLIALKSKPGDAVFTDDTAKQFTRIKLGQFESFKFKVKNKNVYIEGKELRTEKGAVLVDIEDGAVVR